jgi:adenylate kinase family enzyme
MRDDSRMQREMRRVAVIGCPGAGKSTFARRLGSRTGLPVIHLDEHFWRPGWEPTPDDEWNDVVRDLAAGDEWIIDGNYTRTIDVRARAADTVVLLDYPALGCVARALRRSVTQFGKEVQARGCPERVDPQFLRWIAGFRRHVRPRVLEAIATAAPDVKVHILEGPKEADWFLARHA